MSMATGETVYLGKSLTMAANAMGNGGTMLGVGPSPEIAKCAALAHRQTSLDGQAKAMAQKARARRMQSHLSGAITSNGAI